MRLTFHMCIPVSAFTARIRGKPPPDANNRKADMLHQAQGQAFKRKQAVRDGTGRENR